ncbi:MAG: leucine-rich repeat domain-containing protein, partial [Acetatifactor sp.]|nr:leucine-rich repeat domain-containing protein [Acetatifactor sp.]
MKIKWNVIGIMLIITAVLIMQIPISEADAASSASDFQMDGTTLISYTGNKSSVSVPSTVETIGRSAFENNTTITQVNIPDSVKQIEPYAFWGCNNLEQVKLGEGLYEVGDYAFTNCPRLKTVSFPANIGRIGIMAFADCVSLRNIRIPYTVYSVEDTAFDGCYRLEIEYDSGTEGERFALYFAEKKKEMPEYEDIDEYEDAVTETPVPVPDVTPVPTQPPVSTLPGRELGSTVVVGNMAVVFMDNTSPSVSTGNLSGIQEDTQGQMMPEYTTEKDKGTVKYTLINGKVLADRAYYGYQNLNNVSLPEGMEEIGEFSFARSSLQTVAIPEGVSSIGYGAFYHCDQLTEVQLPSTITNIAPKAFDYTGWVKNFLAEGDTDFLIAGDGILIAYRGNSERVTVPEGVRQIGPEVFQGHQEITAVSLPDSVEIIGEAAFAQCSNLTELTGMSGVKIIRDRAFYHCPLKQVTLPDTVASLGLGAFARESRGGVVVLAGQIPLYGEETSASRKSNEGYRINAFDNVEYVLTAHPLTDKEPQGSVLNSERTVYNGIIGHLDGSSFIVDDTYLTSEELQGITWTKELLIGGERYEQQGMDQIQYLTPTWQDSQEEGLAVIGNTELQARLEPQEAGERLQVQRLNGIGEAPELDAAYRRIYQQGLPMDTICY